MTVRRGIKFLSIGIASLLVTAILFTAGFATYNRWNFPGHIYPWAEPDSYDDILALAQRGEAEKALNAVQDIKYDVHGSVRDPAMRDVVGILAERGQIKEIREFASQLRDKIEGNSFLIELAKAQAETGDVDDALESVGFIAGRNDIAAGLHRVAIGAARSGNIDRALTIARSMESADDRNSALNRVGPNLVESGDTAARRENVEKALALMRSMGSADSRIAALNRIGLILAESGDPAAGREIVEEALAIARSITDEPSNRLAVTETAIAIAELGDWQYAAELAAAAAPGDRESYVQAEISKMQFEAGAVAAAHDTARRIANVHYRDNAVEKIMRSQLEDGNLAEALKTAAIIPAGAERDEFLSGIAGHFPYAYRPKGAKMDVTETALAVADAIEDYIPRDSAYLCVSGYAASQIDMITAIKIIFAIEGAEMRKQALVWSYHGLLYGYSLCTPYS